MTVDKAGKPKTPYLKTLVGLTEGYMTEEMVIFAGAGALDRARATEEILRKRFVKIDLKATEIRFDYIGVNAVHREASPDCSVEPYEVVLRVGLKAEDRAAAAKLRQEIDPLAVNGMAATGKWATTAGGSRLRTIVGLNSCLVPRSAIKTSISIFQS